MYTLRDKLTFINSRRYDMYWQAYSVLYASDALVSYALNVKCV